ncbi:hypothetical protein R3P38DRAFT_3267066 [Favolaschia claudopus]|uniref:Uncharacterized protein n=1 Tax=Favolaschia claudopus TaxID=2862362 RepID=A0AAW0BRQ2_9AGAR
MEVDEDPTAGVLNSTGASDSSNSPDAVEKPDANHCDDLLGVDQASLDEHETESLPAAEEFESEEETFRHPRVLKVRKIGEAVCEYLVHGHGFEPAQWLAYEEDRPQHVAQDKRTIESDDSDLDSRSKSNNTSVDGSDYDGNSDHPSDEDYGVKKGKRKVPASTPLTALTSEDLSDQPIAALDRLLNSKSLTAELDTLRSERDIVAPLKGRKIALSDVLRQLVERNERNNIDSSFLSFAPLSDERSFLVQLLRVHEQLDIVKRMVQWDICRAHLLLYEWFLVTGRGLAQHLVRNAGQARSRLCQEVQKGKQTARKKQKTATDDQPNTSAIAPSTSEFQQVPTDLYGLIKPKKPGAFKLPAIRKVAQKPQALYTAAVECLLNVLSRELVIVHMAPRDDSWMTPQRRAARKKVQDKKPKTSGSVGEELEKVRARIICRGAVLQCLAKVCEGESTFASEGMHEVLMSPTGLVPRKWREDSRFAAALQRDEETTLSAVIEVLQAIVRRNRQIPECAAALSAFVHRRTLELHRGRQIPEDEYLNPNQAPSNAVPLAAPTLKEPRRKHIPYANLTSAQLIGGDSITSANDSVTLFAPLVLIIRETLRERNKQPACNTSLLKDTRPIHNGTTELLTAKIPPHQATGRQGLSNLLAWHLTGQGNGTQGFLDTQETMCFKTGQACVQAFTDADHKNDPLREDFGKRHSIAPPPTAENEKKIEDGIKKMAGYVPTHNANAYGEAADSLNLKPSRKDGKPKLTIEEKFLPLYTAEVQNAYAEYLRDLLDQDPETYCGKRKKWKETLDFIQSFEFYGMKSDGLTTLQLANNMALLGICEHPQAEEMAAWIAEKGELGAYKGLKHLGFNLNGSDPLATRAAFLCLYNHLDTHLSVEDKKTLGFGVIFCEHVLCKVQRWQFRYDKNMRLVKFLGLVADLIQNEEKEYLPFPFRIGIAGIDAAINRRGEFDIDFCEYHV